MCESDNQTSNKLKTNSEQTLNSKKMKKMKKSLLTLLSAILMVGCFTSCLENEIPEEVTAIYEQQSNVLAAQAMMIQAQADEKSADAALVRASVDLKNAQVEAQLIANAMASAQNVIDLATKQAQLEQLVADALQAAEMAKIELLAAQAALDVTLAQLADQIRALNDANLAIYFKMYTAYLGTLNGIQSSIIDKQIDKLQLTANINVGVISEENALAVLTLELTETKAKIAILETDKIELTASIAAGTSVGDNNARLEALEAELLVLMSKSSELYIARTEKENEVRDAQNAFNILNVNIKGLDDEHKRAVVDFNAATQLVVAKNLEAKANSKLIVKTDSLVERYDADKKALTTASEEAKIAVKETAAASVAATRTDFVTDSIFTVEKNALTELKVAEAIADTELNKAANNYTNKLKMNSGKANVTAAKTVLTRAETEFNEATDIYNAKPNGRTYVDGGRDKILGDHSDDTGTIQANNNGTFTRNGATDGTFAQIATITGAPGAPNNPQQTATFNAGRSSGIPAGQSGVGNRILGEFLNGDGTQGNPNDLNNYSDIEADDITPALNVDRYNKAVNELEAARIVFADAEKFLAEYEEDLAKLKTILDKAQNLFENAEALVAAQEAVVLAADKANKAAKLAVTAAVKASIAAIAADVAATVALNVFPTSKQVLLDLSAQLAVNNQQIAIDIADLAIEITKLEENIARILAQIEIGKTPEAIAAEELLATLTAELDALQSEFSILMFNEFNARRVIAAIELVLSRTTDIKVIENLIASFETNIKNETELLATIEISIKTSGNTSDLNAALGVVQLARIDSDIVALESRGDFYTMLVAKYKALVDSLL